MTMVPIKHAQILSLAAESSGLTVRYSTSISELSMNPRSTCILRLFYIFLSLRTELSPVILAARSKKVIYCCSYQRLPQCRGKRRRHRHICWCIRRSSREDRRGRCRLNGHEYMRTDQGRQGFQVRRCSVKPMWTLDIESVWSSMICLWIRILR